MPSIKIRPNESFDVGLRKFKRAVERAGIIPEVRKREFYEKPTAVLKRKKAAAVKREQKNQKKQQARSPSSFLSLLFKLYGGNNTPTANPRGCKNSHEKSR